MRILPLAADCPAGVGLAISVVQVRFCVVLARSAGGRWWSVVCVDELGRCCDFGPRHTPALQHVCSSSARSSLALRTAAEAKEGRENPTGLRYICSPKL